MTNSALDISANKHYCRVERTKTLLNLPFDFVLPLLPPHPSVICLVFCLISLSEVSCLPFFNFFFLLRKLTSNTLVSLLLFFSSISLSLSLSFPVRRLTQSLLRVRKQTQIILGTLLACDRGLASRFKWEHMEIITANWHTRELACPPGKEEMKSAQIAGLHSSQHPPVNIPQKEPPELGCRQILLNDVVTCLVLRQVIPLCYTDAA